MSIVDEEVEKIFKKAGMTGDITPDESDEHFMKRKIIELDRRYKEALREIDRIEVELEDGESEILIIGNRADVIKMERKRIEVLVDVMGTCSSPEMVKDVLDEQVKEYWEDERVKVEEKGDGAVVLRGDNLDLMEFAHKIGYIASVLSKTEDSVKSQIMNDSYVTCHRCGASIRITDDDDLNMCQNCGD